MEQVSIAKAKWYENTYQLFVNHPLNSINDFWLKVIFAYSWMPTIPKWIREAVNEEYTLEVLQKIQKGEKPIKEDLIMFVGLINNSIVGTSKVLHFIAPDYVPVLDSKVLENWNWFFKKTATATFPKTYTTGKKIDVYLECW